MTGIARARFVGGWYLRQERRGLCQSRQVYPFSYLEVSAATLHASWYPEALLVQEGFRGT